MNKGDHGLCPEGNLFLTPMCDTCNKTQENGPKDGTPSKRTHWFELKPGTILVETCVHDQYTHQKPRLVIYLPPDKYRRFRPDCQLKNKQPRDSAVKHAGLITRTSLLSYYKEESDSKTSDSKIVYWCMACDWCVTEYVFFSLDPESNVAKMTKVLASKLTDPGDNWLGFVLVQILEILEKAVREFREQVDSFVKIKNLTFHFGSLHMSFETPQSNQLEQLAKEIDSKIGDEDLIKSRFEARRASANEEDSKALEEAEQYFLAEIMPCKEKTKIITDGAPGRKNPDTAPAPPTSETVDNAAERTKKMRDAAAEAVHEMCMDKMAWARSQSLDAPPKLGEKLKEAMMRRAQVMPPSEIKDVNRLLEMCSGGRALKGCIPTTQFWSKRPIFSLMGTPKDARLKSLPWHNDFEYHFESLSEASDTLTMAKSFGTSSAHTFVKDTRWSFLGFSGGKRIESTSTEETKMNSSVALTQKSRAQTVHHLRLKSIARFKIELPSQEGLPLSQRALEDLRSLYEIWKLRAADSGSASRAGDQETQNLSENVSVKF